jgi:glycosyltransferase involved in cell wall biosynthesis
VKAAEMRVLLTLDSVGGVWQYGVDLARALGQRGVATVLAHMGPAPSPAQRAEATLIENGKLIETGLPLDWLVDGPKPIMEAGAAVTQLAHDERVDVVQLNMPTLGASVRADVPVVAVAHGCVATWWQAVRGDAPLAPEFHWHRLMSGDGLRAADVVVAPTAAYAQTIARQYGLSRVPLAIHNGRTPAHEFSVAATSNCVFTAGRLWDEAKNAALMDRVASRLPVPFYAAGPVTGPHGETAALGHLHVLGTLGQDALRQWLEQQPVFVSAATFEPFGLAVLEAAQAGCPLVLSDIPTFRELWDGAALFAAPDSEGEFVSAIECVTADPALRASLSAAALDRAADYTPAAMAGGMLAIYDRVLLHERAA